MCDVLEVRTCLGRLRGHEGEHDAVGFNSLRCELDPIKVLTEGARFPLVVRVTLRLAGWCGGASVNQMTKVVVPGAALSSNIFKAILHASGSSPPGLTSVALVINGTRSWQARCQPDHCTTGYFPVAV